MAFVTTSTPRTGLGHTLLSPVRVLARAMDWIRECNRMGSEYVQLSHKTDARLTIQESTYGRAEFDAERKITGSGAEPDATSVRFPSMQNAGRKETGP